MPQPQPVQDEFREPLRREDREPDGSVARLVAIIVSAGLAWATAVTLVAWVLGRLLAGG